MESASTQKQTLPLGPIASQEAIKELGTNGGGFLNANSAHPYENPTALSNCLEMLAILLIPAALTYTFGTLVGDTRQGWAIFAAMAVLLLAELSIAAWNEQLGNPRIAALGVDQSASVTQPGGNMEGKEARFGIAASALFATITTATSCGAVNSMHDSFTPLGGFVPLFHMQLGEVVFGGVGTGLYSMLIFAIVGVFIAGLMIGRTPEYLGKKIEAFEMKMSSIAILVMPFIVLVGAAVAVSLPAGRAGVGESWQRTASRRSSTPSPRRATITAARSPAFRPTRPSTTARWHCACGSGASGRSSRCWRWPGRWPRKSASR